MSDETPVELRKKKQTPIYFVIMLFMIITGALNTIFLNLQNDYYETILDRPFIHPWFQSITMFIGEAYCMIMWLVYKYWWLRRSKKSDSVNLPADSQNQTVNESQEVANNELQEPSPWIFIIPCLCDLVGSTLLNFALLRLNGSVFQMLRGGIIIVTAVFVMIFIKIFPKNFQWLGIFFVFVGVFLVGLAFTLFKNSDSKSTSYEGILILIVSLIFQGLQFIYEEKVLIKYNCNALQVIAWEGVWGLLAFCIILPIFEHIPCDWNNMELVKAFCSQNQKGDYYLEQTLFAFKQMFDKIPMFFFNFGQTFSICGFNLFGIMIVQYSSSTTRSVMDSTRTILVWIFFLTVPMYNGKKTEFFIWLQLVGFIVLVFGQLVYNGIIKIPLFGLDKHFNKEEVKEQNLKVDLLNDT